MGLSVIECDVFCHFPVMGAELHGAVIERCEIMIPESAGVYALALYEIPGGNGSDCYA